MAPDDKTEIEIRKASAGLSMLVDGFIAGPNAGPQNAWVMGVTEFISGAPTLRASASGKTAPTARPTGVNDEFTPDVLQTPQLRAEHEGRLLDTPRGSTVLQPRVRGRNRRTRSSISLRQPRLTGNFRKENLAITGGAEPICLPEQPYRGDEIHDAW